MKTRLSITIENTGTILPTLTDIIGKHNSGKQTTDMMAVDMLLFRMKNEIPGAVITTKKQEWDGGFFNLEVYENGVLVAVIESDEVWGVVEKHNACNDIVDVVMQPVNPIAN